FWGATVAESGGLKTPPYLLTVGPLKDIQANLNDEHAKLLAKYEQDLETWQDEDKSRRGKRPQKPPEAPTYTTGAVTIEAMADVLRATPRGTLLARDELDAWFGSLVRYKGKAGGSDRPNWLELHHGGHLDIRRKTGSQRVIHVRRALASIFGTI